MDVDAMQKEIVLLKSEVARLQEENDALLYAIREKNDRLLALSRRS